MARPVAAVALHRPSRVFGRLVWIVAGAVLGLHVAVALGAGGAALAELFSTWVYVALLTVAAGACLLRAREPGTARRERVAWTLLAAAPALWATGELTWLLVLEERELIPYPSPADALWLAAYPAAGAGVVVLVRARLRAGAGPGPWLDAAIGATAFAALVAWLLLGPVLDDAEDGWALATDLAYPLGDLALLALVVAAIGSTGWHPGRGWALLAAGLAFQAIADALAVRATALDLYEEGGLLAALVPWAWILLAFAAWSPLPTQATLDLERSRVLVVPTLASVFALGLLVLDHVTGIDHVAAGLAATTLALAVARMALGFRENARSARRAREEARTDALTGLRNRRALVEDLEARLATATAASPGVLALFDLDGFKRYNDEFGHPAGDVLLARLGGKLRGAASAGGRAYRLGGDEFCLLLDAPGSEPVIAAALGALTERGKGFSISASSGTVRLPREAADPATAMQLADRRMYAAKDGRTSSALRQSRDVLLKVLAEREPDLHDHVTGVTSLARGVARRLDLSLEEEEVVARAAELHDIGKMAIPDAILNKPGRLDPSEWRFMRRHTVIGEDILSVAPALQSVAALVRAHHERWDGTGYPDGVGGEAIPLGARIVAVCDAFNAMTQERAYQHARSVEDAAAEIERGAGTHFDPRVVDAFSVEVALATAGRM